MCLESSKPIKSPSRFSALIKTQQVGLGGEEEFVTSIRHGSKLRRDSGRNHPLTPRLEMAMAHAAPRQILDRGLHLAQGVDQQDLCCWDSGSWGISMYWLRWLMKKGRDFGRRFPAWARAIYDRAPNLHGGKGFEGSIYSFRRSGSSFSFSETYSLNAANCRNCHVDRRIRAQVYQHVMC